jgi:hypothetical protein
MHALRGRGDGPHGVLQFFDRAVEVVAQLLVAGGKFLVEAEYQITTRKPFQPGGDRLHGELHFLCGLFERRAGSDTLGFNACRKHLRLSLQLELFEPGFLEHQHRARHAANLITALATRHVDLKFALGQPAHAHLKLLYRRHHPTSDREEPDAEHECETADNAGVGDEDGSVGNAGQLIAALLRVVGNRGGFFGESGGNRRQERRATDEEFVLRCEIGGRLIGSLGHGEGFRAPFVKHVKGARPERREFRSARRRRRGRLIQSCRNSFYAVGQVRDRAAV